MSEIKVIRGAKLMRVSENELDKYLSKGYVLYGEQTIEPKQEEKLSEPITQPTPDVVEEPLFTDAIDTIKKPAKRSRRK